MSEAASIPSLPPAYWRFQSWALIVGILALLACVVGWIFWPDAFFRAWLFSWMFWLGITLGSMTLVMIYHLTGGGWGRSIQRLAEAAFMNLPLMLVLFIPVFFGLRHLYPWADPHDLKNQLVWRHLAHYENRGLFIVRTLFYFAVFIGMAWALARMSRKYDQTHKDRYVQRMRAISAGGLVVYTLVISLASVDWLMSREPHWYSTVYGFIIAVGQALAGLVFLVIILSLLSKRPPLSDFVTPEHWNDLGNLLLTCVILWAYVSFAQLLVTWQGNVRDEVRWYTQRSNYGYSVASTALIVFHFFVPFFLLLGRNFKRDPRRMVRLCVLLLLLRLVAAYWMVMPSGESGVAHLNFNWLNFVAPVGIGGVWLALYFLRLSRMRLLAEREHTVVDAMKYRGRGSPKPDSN